MTIMNMGKYSVNAQIPEADGAIENGRPHRPVLRASRRRNERRGLQRPGGVASGVVDGPGARASSRESSSHLSFDVVCMKTASTVSG